MMCSKLSLGLAAAALLGGTAVAGVLHDFTFAAKESGALKYGGAELQPTVGLEGRTAAIVDRDTFVAPRLGFAKEPFSLVIWVKPLALGTQQGNAGTSGGMLVANGNGYTEGFRVFAMDWKSRQPRFEIGRKNGAFGIHAKESLSEGHWNCVVATWDCAVMRLYVNGALSAEGAHTEAVLPANEGFRIGFAGAGVGSFKQAFDRVLVYDHALSPGEVEALVVKPKTEEWKAWQKLKAPRGGRKDSPYNSPLYWGLEGNRKDEIAVCVEIMGKASLPDWLRGEASERLLQICRSDAGGMVPSDALEKLAAAYQDSADADLRKKLVFALGESYAREKKMQKAVGIYQKLLAGSDTLDIRETYARLLWAAGQLALAREQYAAIFNNAAHGVSARALAGLAQGKVLMQMKKEREAQEAFSAVAELEGVAPHIKAEAAELSAKQERQPGRQAWKGCPKSAVEFYVAPDGSDVEAGTKEKPFATLARARDAVRAAPKEGGVTVYVRGGRYRVTDTLELTAEDSGAGGNALVVYRAYPSEVPVFDGGVEIKNFEKVTDAAILRRLPGEAQGKVYVADARAQGYPKVEPQKVYGVGYAYENNGGVRELFADGVPQPIARWPNEGWLKTGEQVVTNRAFAFSHERTKRWTEANEVMAMGYWYHLWADGTTPVQIGEDRITFRANVPYGGPLPDHPFYVLNLLEEIDRPGEWFYDCASGKLYAWLANKSAKMVMSRWDKPFIRAKGVRNVVIAGLVYEYGQHDAMVIEQSENIVLAGCMFRRLGGSALTALDMKNFRVFGNSFNTLGHTGMRVRGGDRKTLTSGGIVIENNEVFSFARFGRTYNPALLLEGCGARVAYNHFQDGPSSAMRIEGNDHIIEYNRICNMVTESDDQGGIDMWRDPSYRGNIIRYNHWKNINSGKDDPCGQAAIRLDDAISGVLIYGNYFENTSNGIFGGVQIHAGQFNIIDNNVFMDCKIGVSFSPWSVERFRQFLNEPAVKRIMADVDIDGPLYRARYPTLPVVPERHVENSVWRNLFVSCGQVYFRGPKNTDSCANQVLAGTPDYKEVTRQSVFRPIPPADEMGPYDNPFRITNGKVK